MQLRNELCYIGLVMVNLPGLITWTKRHVKQPDLLPYQFWPEFLVEMIS